MTAESQKIQELEARIKLLEDALHEALLEWEYSTHYKGEYLTKKHHDMDDIAKLRALIPNHGLAPEKV